jgi:hypothetical protein
MSKIAVALSFLAVALASWAAWTASHGANERLDRLDAQIDELRVLETRVSHVEAKVSSAAPPPPRPVEGPRPLARAEAPVAPAAAPTATSVVGATVADLEKRLTAIEEKAKADEAAGARGLARALHGRAAFGPGGVYGSIDDAQEDLDLSPSQRADFERVIADAKRDLEDLHRIPDDEGKTWEQTNQDLRRGFADGRFDLGKMMAFRGKKIPGRSETYGEADQRIRSDAKRRLRDTLSLDQQKKLEKAVVDPIFGVGGGPQMSVTVVGTDDSDDAGMR